jgi:hypothetical protein
MLVSPAEWAVSANFSGLSGKAGATALFALIRHHPTNGYGCTFGENHVAPSLEAECRCSKRSLKLFVGELLKCLQDFAVTWINTFVGHGFDFF